MNTATMTSRDRWLAAALPAMLLALLGWLWLLRPAAREVALLEQRVVNQGPIETQQALLAAAEAELADWEKTIAGKRAQVTAEAPVFDRNEAMKQISKLCAEGGLSLDKFAPDRSGQLPAALKAAQAALAVEGGSRPQLWRLEFSGSYPAVLRLLAAMRDLKPLVVPLNVSMQAGQTDRHPAAWVLALWL
jgi:hypothetical protein